MRFVVLRLAAVLGAVVLISAGCATRTQSHVSELRRDVPDPKVVLMPLDVELMEMNLGGVLEPKPEWSEKAREHLVEELRVFKTRLGFELLDFTRDFEPTDAEEGEVDQLAKVHAVVGRSMMLQQRPGQDLPSLGEKPRWSLGEGVRTLHVRTGADYALFVHVRDSYATDARKLAMVAGLAVGAVLTGGIQSGFASLVDLRNGDVVWFNQLGRPTGDLRTRQSAADTAKLLFTGFPK